MKKCIWIVDDDESILEVMQDLLEEENYQVVVLQDAAMVREKILKQKYPDLMLIDVHMAGGDGITLAQELRENKAFQDVKIILMTADIHIDEKAREARADGHIRKPFAIEDVLQTIQGFVGSA